MAVAKEVLPALGRPLPGKKLGKEILEEFMMVARGMAAKYQPAPPGQPKQPHQNETKFLTYAEFVVNCAWKLAEYQSPKFRAIAVRVEDIPSTAASGHRERREFSRPRHLVSGSAKEYGQLVIVTESIRRKLNRYARLRLPARCSDRPR
jgi:hypothetical protein